MVVQGNAKIEAKGLYTEIPFIKRSLEQLKIPLKCDRIHDVGQKNSIEELFLDVLT